MKTTAFKLTLAAFLVATLAACGRSDGPKAAASTPPNAQPSPVLLSTAAATASPTPTTSPTATATPTPTASPTATATPTPTATARPMVAVGDPRGSLESAPQATGGAPCGVVDLFDFPLDPPDGDRARGGTDFGIYRSRFHGFHAGEDWGLSYRSSFGAPVYAIGHGAVSYAAPLGWGADQGTVVIRHVLADGTVLYSFYGHLDPPSVVLQAGACVARGDEIGRIGRPRTSPHLHFEIRVHLPDGPGPGYWSVDPRLAGWRQPSRTIWESRLIGAPGVLWVRPSTTGLQVLGTMASYVLVGTEDYRLVGIDLRDGTLLWQLALTGRARDALLDARTGTVTTVGWLGDVTTWRLDNADGAGATEAALRLLWKVDLETMGIPHLMPLPGGGVAVGIGQNLYGVSADGRVLWQLRLGAQVAEWAADSTRLIFTTARPAEQVWAVEGGEPRMLADEAGGRPVLTGDAVYLYGATGVTRLDETRGQVDLIYPLPSAYLTRGDMAALSTGELILAHTDRNDKRLIVLDGDGTVQWERSIAGVHPGRPRLVLVSDRPMLLFEYDSAYAADIALFAVDMKEQALIRIMDGGTRYPQPEETWVAPLGEGRLVINLAGGGLLALNAAAAEAAIRQIENAR